MFIGREEELKTITTALNNKSKHVLIYGNRRVGKTTLAIEATKRVEDAIFINYECKKDSLDSNAKALSRLLVDVGLVSTYIPFDSLEAVFSFVDSLNKHVIILIDEYPYLYAETKKDLVDSIFQIIIDQHSKNLNIILSGSHIGMMTSLLKYDNSLFGRFSVYLQVQELDYYDASKFYPNLSNYDKAAFYAVFGGSPFVLSQLDYTKSLEENIKDTYLNNNSAIGLFLSEGYTSDLSTKDYANKIFSVLGNSRLKYTKLEEELGLDKNGLLSKQLKTLLDMNFIGKNSPINKQDDKKKVTYYIKSNALRFFYCYVYEKQNKLIELGKDKFFDVYVNKSLLTFISYRFEGIVSQFISRAIKADIIKDAQDLGTYYYDDAKAKTNGEFDVVIKTEEAFSVIEAKYLKDRVSQKLIDKEIEQVRNIKELKVDKMGFASINGFDEDVEKLDYMFDGNDIYFIN